MNKQAVLQANQKLLDAIAQSDFTTYQDLCSDSITCFEPEAVGHLVEGIDFHKFYFDNSTNAKTSGKTNEQDSKPGGKSSNTTMVQPHVRLLGDTAAVVSYVRLVQRMNGTVPVTIATEETRVWELGPDGKLRNVHIHRSSL